MRRRQFDSAVVLFLSGPVIGTAHFLLVYLLAEAACEWAWLRSDIAGVDGVVAVTLAATLLAAAAAAIAAIAAYRRRGGPHGELAFTGFLLDVLFVIAIVFVGLPPLFFGPC